MDKKFVRVKRQSNATYGRIDPKKYHKPHHGRPSLFMLILKAIFGGK